MVGKSERRSSEVDLELGRKCADSLRRKIIHLPQVQAEVHIWECHSIGRISQDLRKLNPEDFDPKLVSIGPLHRGKPELLAMDGVKMENLRRLLSKKEDSILDGLFQNVFECLRQARSEYSEKIDLLDEEFAEMLVVDGLFIISLFAWATLDTLDPFSLYIYYLDTWTDLLLVENQIPFFVLKQLFEEAASLFDGLLYRDPNLINLALGFLHIKLPQEKYPEAEEVKHLLHLKHISLDPLFVDELPQERSKWQKAKCVAGKVIRVISMPFLWLMYLIIYRDCYGLFGFVKPHRAPLKARRASATELLKDGVSFMRKVTRAQNETTFDLGISFRDGTLEIPSLFFTESTFHELRNLIAFEQYSSGVSLNFTSYCIFLSRLIKTDDDVALLRRSQILKSEFLSDPHIAAMVSGLVKKFDPHSRKNYLDKVYDDLTAFCQLPHHRWRAILLQNYLTNPWTTLSVIAAVLLLLFTAIQTFVVLFPRK